MGAEIPRYPSCYRCGAIKGESLTETRLACGCTHAFCPRCRTTPAHDTGNGRYQSFEDWIASMARIHTERGYCTAAQRDASSARGGRNIMKDEKRCGCVKLNRELGIVTMVDQEREKRRGLSSGLVADTYSARVDCPECKGTGVKP